MVHTQNKSSEQQTPNNTDTKIDEDNKLEGLQRSVHCLTWHVSTQVEVSPSRRILFGPFSSTWLTSATLSSLASTEHLL